MGACGPAGARRAGSGGALAYPWLKRYSMLGRAEHQEHASLSCHAVQKHARLWAAGAARAARICIAFWKGTDMHLTKVLFLSYAHMAERCAWGPDMPAALCRPLLCTV